MCGDNKLSALKQDRVWLRAGLILLSTIILPKLFQHSRSFSLIFQASARGEGVRLTGLIYETHYLSPNTTSYWPRTGLSLLASLETRELFHL